MDREEGLGYTEEKRDWQERSIFGDIVEEELGFKMVDTLLSIYGTCALMHVG
jgi:hypothetical protein